MSPSLGADVKAAHVRRRQPYDNRGQQPGVLTRDATGGGNADHAGEPHGGTRHVAQPEVACFSVAVRGGGGGNRQGAALGGVSLLLVR